MKTFSGFMRGFSTLVIFAAAYAAWKGNYEIATYLMASAAMARIIAMDT